MVRPPFREYFRRGLILYSDGAGKENAERENKIFFRNQIKFGIRLRCLTRECLNRLEI